MKKKHWISVRCQQMVKPFFVSSRTTWPANSFRLHALHQALAHGFQDGFGFGVDLQFVVNVADV